MLLKTCSLGAMAVNRAKQKIPISSTPSEVISDFCLSSVGMAGNRAKQGQV
jgi:hypothetical protein